MGWKTKAQYENIHVVSCHFWRPGAWAGVRVVMGVAASSDGTPHTKIFCLFQMSHWNSNRLWTSL